VPVSDIHKTEHLTIPSDLKWMPKVVAEVERVVREVGFDEEEGDFLAIATTEAVSNAIVHGNRQNASKKVHIGFEKHHDRLIIVVADEGDGFNPQSCEDPTDPKNISRNSGRGIYILKQLMDAVDVASSCQGTTVRLTKYKKKVLQGETGNRKKGKED
jgi:serine/threonine-protein kinase RsbW